MVYSVWQRRDPAQVQVYRGVVDAATGIVRQQGVRGLYNGISITLLEIIPYAAMQFGLYDAFTAAHRKHRRQKVLWLCTYQQGTLLPCPAG